MMAGQSLSRNLNFCHSFERRSKTTPINTQRLKLESLPVVKKTYSDALKEKYLASISQRQEIISQQVET